MSDQKQYIMTLDSGTTSVRTLIINHAGVVEASAQLELTQYFPHSGWVEHDPIEIWNAQNTTMIDAKRQANLKSTDFAALAITNQRETIVVWNKKTGLPIYNAIVWQDARTKRFCETLAAQGYSALFQTKTGLILNPYFSGTKLKWILDNVSGAREQAARGELLAGTIDTWLIYKLTNGQVHATDVSNASRTLLFNIHTQQWDHELLTLLKIPKNILPHVKASSAHYGNVAPEHFSAAAQGIVPISGVIGDQQAALFGQLCTNVGALKNTYGTGCFTLVNTGHQAVQSAHRLLTTIAWKIGQQKTVYALEGSVFVAGAALQWLRDGLKLLYETPQCDAYVRMVQNDDQKIYVVPAFTGLGAPYWDPSARGAIFGLERGTKREHLVKATLESIAYQTHDLIKAIEQDIKQKITTLKVDGGVAHSQYLMQFQASLSELAIVRPTNTETTALGAAYMAGLAVQYWSTIAELKTLQKIDQTFKPQFSKAKIEKLTTGWNAAITSVLGWTKALKKTHPVVLKKSK